MGWKEMTEPVSLEEYSNQIRRHLGDQPVNLSADLAQPPLEAFYATFDPERLQDRYRGATYRYTHDGVQTVRNNLSHIAPASARREIISYLIPGTDGLLTVTTPPQSSMERNDRHGTPLSDNAKAPPPPHGARMGVHNHVSGRAMGFADDVQSTDGYGDSMSLAASNPVPMATVARPAHGPFKGEDVIGLREMVNGQLNFQAPYGAVMEENERRLIQKNLDLQQQQFYRR